jgi:hypothetical protein
MKRIGEEVSARYHYEAPKVWVERHIRPKYELAERVADLQGLRRYSRNALTRSSACPGADPGQRDVFVSAAGVNAAHRMKQGSHSATVTTRSVAIA